VRALRRICTQHQIEIVHSNGLKPHIVSALARFVGGPPTIAHIRDIPFTSAEKAVWRLLRHAADRVILVSSACWPDEKLPRNVIVIRNGVDVSSILVREFHPAAPLRIGFIGRIDAAKGLHLLLSWIAEAKRAALDLRLIVRGRFDSQPYRAQIDAEIGRLGMEHCVEFQSFVADPEAVYSDIDAVCVPSHVPDPLPRAVMEPMARGIPVIAYPAGGILDMIEDRRTGFLASNAHEFVVAVSSMRAASPLLSEILSNARARIETDFSLELAYRNLDKIYLDLV
jgi:glycosyltransferase involved in cell wall biosynthesis